ncbi:hypothetical protein L3Q82_020864 [Scortum barcoo]|uniref:Uncharacterized protein n=1 Tax=Scortum barcoo TaxID=214431 RepID=A0ACB8V920_9TELE|nr:hypothetical protein L3Q82_020864 [Scortum barcoo]
MERVAVDILGPFPATERGNRYILVAMDYFTKWPEAYAVPDQSAATTAEHLVNEMFCRFGVPKKNSIATKGGTLRLRSARLGFAFTLGPVGIYRTAVQESTRCTPAVLMFGHELRTPVDLIFGPPPEPEVEGEPGLDYLYHLRERLNEVHNLTRQTLAAAGVRQKRAYDSRCSGGEFAAGAQVWVYCPERKKGLSPKLMSHWIGPCTVLERLSDVVYRVRLVKRNRVVVLHRDRLAPYQPLVHSMVESGAEDQPQSSTTLPKNIRGAPERTRRRRQLPQHLKDFVVDTWKGSAEQSGAAEACWAYNPVFDGSVNFFIQQGSMLSSTSPSG